MASQEELRRTITDQIVESLKSGGIPPWRRPWGISPNSGFPTNVLSKRRYSGVNVLLLRMAAMTHGFTSKYWATFNQWRDMGGRIQRRPDHVKPGHWGQNIVFFTGSQRPRRTRSPARKRKRRSRCSRPTRVFNVDQVDGPFDHLRVKEESLDGQHGLRGLPTAEELIKAMGADIRFGGDRAFYNRTGDYIQMPPKHRFEQENEYYGVVAHELTHWTESQMQLDRLVSRR